MSSRFAVWSFGTLCILRVSQAGDRLSQGFSTNSSLPPIMAAETRKHPFLLQVDEVVEDLKTNLDKGLTSSQVTQLQQKYPPNELDIGSGIAWYTIFIRQLCNAMILVRLSLIPFTMSPSLGSLRFLVNTIQCRFSSSPWP